MKLIKKILLVVLPFVAVLSDKVFCASAYLEGQEPKQDPSFLDNLDASLIMANWYKIVLIIVAIVCTVGFIVANLKKSDKNSND